MNRKYGRRWIACLAVLAAVLLWRPAQAQAETQPESGSQAAPRLEELNLEPVAVEFQPEVYEYRITVPEETEKVLVKAVASEGITYTVNGNDGLQMGENQISVRLTAETGETSEYIIHVFRGEEASPGSAGVPGTTASAAGTETAAEMSALGTEKEDGGFWGKFGGFLTGNKAVLTVFGILLLSVLLLGTVIVLLFKSGVRRAEKQKEEEAFRRKKEALERRMAEKKKPQAAAEKEQKAEAEEDEDFDIIDL